MAQPKAVVGGRRWMNRRGTILIVTIWIIMALAGLVLVMARMVRVETFCSANEFATLQAEAVEQGAIQYVLSRVDSLQGGVPTETDVPCEAVRVGQGAFWILRPNEDDDQTFAYAIADEASKVNLDTASRDILMRLPDMTDELGGGIIDWRDADSDVSAGGAENEYYLLLDDPYQCKNSALETVGELFLIKGATPQIIFGEDLNRNGVLDPNENDGDISEPPDNADGVLDKGLAAFATVFSAEPNTDANGQRRTNVNEAGGPALTRLLSNSMSASRAAAVTVQILQRRQQRRFRNVMDFYVRGGLTATEFQPIADQVTTSSDTVLKGLINVNTAPKEVLACLPGLGDAEIATLMAKRQGTGTDLTSVAWVAQALSPEKAVAVGSYITAHSYVFSADIVSLSGDGRAFRRCRILVDAQGSPPKVIYREDLTRLGWPLAPELLAAARAAGSLDNVGPSQTLLQGVNR